MCKVILAMTLTIYCHIATADYVATSPIEGNVCHGFGIEWCGYHRVAAVEGSDGKIYTMATHFERVSDYKTNPGRCWIDTKSKGWGLISLGINVLAQPVFYERSSSGDLEKIDVEYLVFKCAKR